MRSFLMSVKRRSFLSFGVILLLIVILGIFQQFQSNSQLNTMKIVKEKTLQSSLLADELKLSVVQVQQYLSDISATRAQNGLDDGFEKAEEQSQKFESNIEKLKQLNPSESSQLESIQTAFDAYYTDGKQMAEAYIKGGPVEGNQIMLQFDSVALEINEKVDEFQTEKVSAINNSLLDIEDSIHKNEKMFVIIGMVILVISIVISILLSKSINTPLRNLMKSTEIITNGDLRQSVLLKSKDEFGKLSESFEQMRLNLGDLISKIHTTSNQVATSSEELMASAEETGKATEQITIAIQEVAMETERQATASNTSSQAASGVASGMNQAAMAIQSVADLSNDAKDHAGKGNQVIQQMLGQMDLIHQKVDSAACVIHRLGQKSKEIGQITSLITDIASQTNLLALNAEIEAARAGEHGKGFAVVADEVKKLAEQSRESASNIQELINHIQIESDNAIYSMDEGTASVKDGITMTSKAGNAFEDIANSVQEIFEQIHEVSAVVDQVSANTDHMMGDMNAIMTSSEVASRNAKNVAASAEEQNSTMEEIFTSAEALSKMATDLHDTVNQFKL